MREKLVLAAKDSRMVREKYSKKIEKGREI